VNSLVSVTIVTCNDARHIRRCLDAVLRQEGGPIEVVVVDNGSTDGTRDILAALGSRIRVIRNGKNVGYAQAQNQAIGTSTGDWVLTLNPDVLLLPGFIRSLRDAGDQDPSVGSVCGRLLAIGPGFRKLPQRRLDSTGMYFTPAMRHFDRGWRQPDNMSFQKLEYVFGATAAAALYRRRMINDIAIDGSFFDPDFFVYREDADVAWRAMLLGWRCLYTPVAVGYHVRRVTPANRRSLPAFINMHSVKNRFLMRVKNATAGLYRRYWLPMTWRDIVVIGGTLLTEPGSLPAYWHLVRCLPRALRQRREIMRRRRVSDDVLASWFCFEPASQPALQIASPELERGVLAPAVGLAGRAS
jgi:GT2 family glycosyltransferase